LAATSRAAHDDDDEVALVHPDAAVVGEFVHGLVFTGRWPKPGQRHSDEQTTYVGERVGAWGHWRRAC
jgi:hypothetical protein